MNPTLAAALAAIAPHITWAAGYDSRVEASTHIVAELELLLAEAQAAAPPPDADLTDRALWLAALVAEEARDALAYHRGLLDCTGTPPA